MSRFVRALFWGRQDAEEKESPLVLRNTHGIINNPTHGTVWVVGDMHDVDFQTEFTSYTIALWQQKPKGGANLGPILFTLEPGQALVPSFKWKVSTYNFDTSVSEKFFLWMFEGSNPKLQGSSGLPNISSGYFNITKTQPLVVTTTAASISTTTSSISSSATSSTTSSSKSSATSSAISPSSSSSSSSSLSFSLSSSSLSLSSSATSSITTIPTGSGAGVGTSAGVGAETNGGGISNAATDNTNGPAVSQVVPISVGVSVGVVSLAAIVALVLWLLKRKRKQQKLANTAELPSTSFTTAPSMGPPYGGLPPYNKPVEAMDHNERYSWAQSDATAVNKPHELSVPPIIKPQELHAHPALAELG